MHIICWAVAGLVYCALVLTGAGALLRGAQWEDDLWPTTSQGDANADDR